MGDAAGKPAANHEIAEHILKTHAFINKLCNTYGYDVNTLVTETSPSKEHTWEYGWFALPVIMDNKRTQLMMDAKELFGNNDVRTDSQAKRIFIKYDPHYSILRKAIVDLAYAPKGERNKDFCSLVADNGSVTISNPPLENLLSLLKRIDVFLDAKRNQHTKIETDQEGTTHVSKDEDGTMRFISEEETPTYSLQAHKELPEKYKPYEEWAEKLKFLVAAVRRRPYNNGPVEWLIDSDARTALLVNTKRDLVEMHKELKDVSEHGSNKIIPKEVQEWLEQIVKLLTRNSLEKDIAKFRDKHPRGGADRAI